MSPDKVSSPGPLALESDALPTALCGSAFNKKNVQESHCPGQHTQVF